MTEQDLPVTAAFHPFYEWFPDRFAIPFIVKMMIAGAAGFLYLIPRFLVVRNEIIADWSWLLCVIIIAALICLYYATHTFRAMFQQLNLRLPDEEAKFPERIEHLSNRDFLVFGLIFAGLNCGVGLILDGLDINSWANNFGDKATLYIGFFLAGFACGMPVAGIRGVVITLTHYFDCGPKVDYTNPDGCGGFLFVGDALIKFSAVTMIVGILISIFILEFAWLENTDPPPELWRALMWIWIALPFLLSLTILMAPASRSNQVLMNHKIEIEVELALLLSKARNGLEESNRPDQQNKNEDVNQRQKLQHEIEHLNKLRGQLHKMRVWPLNAETNIKFGFLFITNALVAFKSVEGLINRVPH